MNYIEGGKVKIGLTSFISKKRFKCGNKKWKIQSTKRGVVASSAFSFADYVIWNKPVPPLIPSFILS